MKTPLRIALLGCAEWAADMPLQFPERITKKPEFLTYDVYSECQIEISPLADKLELAGIYDIDEARMRWVAEKGWHCYGSYEEILNDETVDAVLIATPNHLHKEQAIRALRAGKHVLCEKPVMLSSQDLLDVMTVAKEKGLVFYPARTAAGTMIIWSPKRFLTTAFWVRPFTWRRRWSAPEEFRVTGARSRPAAAE